MVVVQFMSKPSQDAERLLCYIYSNIILLEHFRADPRSVRGRNCSLGTRSEDATGAAPASLEKTTLIG